MKLGLLIPDGVGARNFVLGPFLAQASHEGEVVALHTIPSDTLPLFRARLNGGVSWHDMIPYVDRPMPFLLRNCLALAQMKWIDNYPMRLQFNRKFTGSWKRRLVMHAAKLVGRASGSPKRIQALDRLHMAAVSRMPEVERYRTLFSEMKPSLLFCTNQRSNEVLPAVLAARSLGIPTAAYIFSWDNLSTKGRIAAPFEHFLVWSQHMLDELLRYYPDVSQERVHVVGTPQFDPYGDPSLRWSREEFCRRIGADPQRKLICFSGGDVGNSPEDPQHVRVLLKQIAAGRIPGRPQVLLRPSPADPGHRYDDLRREHPELIYAAPMWQLIEPVGWTSMVPLPDDVQMLANVVHHCDVNVNFGSTMTLDFAIHDRPVINVAFDVSDPPVYHMPMWDHLKQFDHYRPVISLGAARIARTADELAAHVCAYLENPALDKEGRRKFVELEVGVPVGQSSHRILEVLRKLSNGQ